MTAVVHDSSLTLLLFVFYSVNEWIIGVADVISTAA